MDAANARGEVGLKTVAASPTRLMPPEVPAADQPACLRSMQTLLQAVPSLFQAPTLADLQTAVCRSVRTCLDAQGACFVMRAEGQCCYVEEDAIAPLWKGRRFPLRACVSGWAMLQGEVVIIPDAHADDRVPQTLYRSTFVRGLVVTPIQRDTPVGAIGCYWSTPRTPRPHERWLLGTLAEFTALAMERLDVLDTLGADLHARSEALEQANSALAGLAVTDALTGLLNRSELMHQAERCLNQARRNGHPLAVMTIELDQFDGLADRLGPDATDALLRAIGEVMHTQARSSDLAARWAGQRFVMLLPDTSRESAAQHAARLQYRLRMIPLEGDVLTASIGISDYEGRQSDRLERVLLQAEHALALARQQGGDQVVVEPR